MQGKVQASPTEGGTAAGRTLVGTDTCLPPPPSLMWLLIIAEDDPGAAPL